MSQILSERPMILGEVFVHKFAINTDAENREKVSEIQHHN
jgi:hypothetical protein